MTDEINAYRVSGCAPQDEAMSVVEAEPAFSRISETGLFDRIGLDDPARERRLGIMGGTFDPIHLGHLVCAEQAREQFCLDGVIFMPTGQPAWKLGSGVTPAADRLSMVRIAVADNPAFDLSVIEAERCGVTYTVDTLQFLHDVLPENVRLYFITGSDALIGLASWQNAERMSKLASFVAAGRPGYDLSEALAAYKASSIDFDLHLFEVPALSISSTDLRWRLSHGRSVRYLVPQGVGRYIREHGLYRMLRPSDAERHDITRRPKGVGASKADGTAAGAAADDLECRPDREGNSHGQKA